MGMDSSPGGQTERPVSSRFTVGRPYTLHVDILNSPMVSAQADNKLGSEIMFLGRYSHGQIAARSPLGSAICILKGWQPPFWHHQAGETTQWEVIAAGADVDDYFGQDDEYVGAGDMEAAT
ncbi:unnamed protein product [Clonostachys byssicola]|uniref:Uncharacterized protein n=1 Tax=Clonostachys byssicola TaxID=160290 RepID=A0A9N9ULV1_9HYPO|nr:unnamed protein product [Clonostachys byssicola]